jgi:hypothetical protein
MRKTTLFVSAFFVFISLLSLYPTVSAEQRPTWEVPPAPEDYWNYEAAEPTSVSTTGPDRGPHWEQTTMLSESDNADILLSSGYYFAGAWTTKDTDGIRAYEIRVTNPSVPHPSDDFFGAYIMVYDDAEQNWFQVGWTEDGKKANDQYILVQHKWPGNMWEAYYEQYNLSPGMSIHVELRHSLYEWTAWLWWNNAWVRLVTRTLSFKEAPMTAQFGEAYVTGTTFYVPDTNFYSIWLYRYIPHIGLRAYLWDTYWGYTTTISDHPYYSYWYNKYWNWYVHYRTGH